MVKGYADLHRLSEDDRITVIGKTVMEHKQVVAVAIDAEPEKVFRYRTKLLQRFPGIVIEEVSGLVRETVTLRCSPPSVVESN